MKGFILRPTRRVPRGGTEYLPACYAEGKLKYDETIVEGFENTIDALHRCSHGQNTGKLLVRVAEPSRDLGAMATASSAGA